MLDSTVTLRMILARPGEVDWRPLTRTYTAAPAKLVRLALPRIEKKTGFHVKVPVLERVALAEAAWTEGKSTYYGDFSDGALTRWQYGAGNDFFVLEQRRILRSDTPEMFIYPSEIRAYQKTINGGIATIVLPPPDVSVSFATWAAEDTVIDAFFFWAVDEASIERILGSLA